ncbi:HD domain-containing protein [Nonomuraea aridisoli]|uniref:HD domain-containing protein n=1 Tax=Nonomuraea aridisoli TaxID=2070368 RepID=UPI001C6507BC|nr:HD domain-containing protein [Nonomuraea aridisoli]
MPEVIAGLEVPETPAVAEATTLVQETTSPLIYHHFRRVFFFGLMHARKLGVEPDPELLYVAAMFHDTGLLTPFSDVAQRFEVDGADHARAFLLDRGFSTWSPISWARSSPPTRAGTLRTSSCERTSTGSSTAPRPRTAP